MGYEAYREVVFKRQQQLGIIPKDAVLSPINPYAQERSADGKPNFEGIWQASSTAASDLQDHAAGLNMLAGRSVVSGGVIPYQPWAADKKKERLLEIINRNEKAEKEDEAALKKVREAFAKEHNIKLP